ncbi:hypothetical protein BG261_05515 [Floricoccus tropicus]|uniref:DUF1351 domain-containing protein n=1 Tax=Floricoccus tropicus TaxID=1859473 RepID=A0A1E8GKZ4_9LACT|nr:DUF1351 domain-containing protein [Floricoccus tropicus]OFI48847.1 hypothetical protein BG261_05515 [Floricoccus tropicus]
MVKDVTNSAVPSIDVSDVNIDYTPSILTIAQAEAIAGKMEEMKEHYDGYEVTLETLKEDRDEKAKINKVLIAFDDERKKVKKEFNKPLDKFEKDLKTLLEPLDNIHEDMKKQIQEVDENIKNQRQDVINILVTASANEKEVDPNLIEMNPKWLNAAYFKNNFEETSKLKKEITEAVQNKADELRRRKNIEDAISTQAIAIGTSPTPYLYMIDQDKEISEILQIMTKDVEETKAREEQRLAELKQQAQDYEDRKLAEDFGMNETDLVVPVPYEAESTDEFPAILNLKITLENSQQQSMLKSFLEAYDIEHEALFFGTVKEWNEANNDK